MCVDHTGNPCPDDGLFCNGTESCNETGNQCISSGAPCIPPDVCDEESDYCVTAGSGSWWNNEWNFRKALTIDANQIDAPLTDFPLLVDLTDDDLALEAQPEGDDIAFTDLNGSKLGHEIEFYDDLNGHLIAWVNIPSLSATEDTTIYLYFGNSGAVNQEDPENTWDSSYVMVQHLEETSGTHADSTGNGNDGTASAGTDQEVQGFIDGADGFDGAVDYLNCGSAGSLDITGSMTVEAWVYSNSGAAMPQRIAAKDRTGVVGKFIFWENASGDLAFIVADPGSTWYRAQGDRVPDGVWMHVTGVYDAQSRQVKLYRDGVEISTVAGPAALKSNTETVTIGASDNNEHNWNGILDEVRISAVARSAGWIQTSYTNQNDPDGFSVIGVLETKP
jgi:MSHA biogenesis protein MshQ